MVRYEEDGLYSDLEAKGSLRWIRCPLILFHRHIDRNTQIAGKMCANGRMGISGRDGSLQGPGLKRSEHASPPSVIRECQFTAGSDHRFHQH